MKAARITSNDKSHFVFVDFPKAVARKILALQPTIA
jgi:hypothetical protein